MRLSALLSSLGIGFLLLCAGLSHARNKAGTQLVGAKTSRNQNARSSKRNFARPKASIRRLGRTRSRRCWRTWRDARRDSWRYNNLLSRYVRRRCQKRLFQQCRRQSFRGRNCRRARWKACFYMHRRLFVITNRLKEGKRRRRRYRCRWRLRLPAKRYKGMLFQPSRRRSR